jgi:hypothetical protein
VRPCAQSCIFIGVLFTRLSIIGVLFIFVFFVQEVTNCDVSSSLREISSITDTDTP